MYTYRVASVARVIDGDTFDLDLDLGFYAQLRIRVRLEDIDTYEVYGKNAHEKGVPGRDFAAAWMQERVGRGTLRIKTSKLNPSTPIADGAFGRWMADVYDSETNDHLADELRAAGFADEV